MNRPERKRMISRNDNNLSLSKQCKVLNISRSSVYYQTKTYSGASNALLPRR